MPVERAVLPLAMWTATVVSAMPDHRRSCWIPHHTETVESNSCGVLVMGTSLQFVIIYRRKWGHDPNKRQVCRSGEMEVGARHMAVGQNLTLQTMGSVDIP